MHGQTNNPPPVASKDAAQREGGTALEGGAWLVPRVVRVTMALPTAVYIAAVIALPPGLRGAVVNLLPVPMPMQAAVEALLYVAGWAGAPGWMLTTDAAGGFRQLRHFQQFRLAVSRSGRLAGPVATACPPPPGWRLATAAELRAAGFRWGGERAPEQNYYDGQAGWDGRVWGGVYRYYFVTADWAEVDPAAGGAVNK